MCECVCVCARTQVFTEMYKAVSVTYHISSLSPNRGATFSFSDDPTPFSVSPLHPPSFFFRLSVNTKSALPPQLPSPLIPHLHFAFPPRPPPPFSLSGAPVPPHSSLPRRFPLLHCMEVAPSLSPSLAPSPSLWEV